ncbi:hypothetical protein [Algoriphagus sp.]|uniref:hypothetical protein n=1 Tax=Algoriphagus sp. TaxID=1872435 RepID=UPI003278868E
MIRSLFIVFILFSCGSLQSGEEILRKSITFHDPEEKWGKLQEKIRVRSDFVYPNTSLDGLMIGLDNAKQLVSYYNLSFDQEILFTDSTCTVISGDKTCEQAAWTKNFYHFILGLPMTLKNDDGIIHELTLDTTFHGIPSYRVAIDFEKENWHFYFDKVDYHLVGFAFNKNFEVKAEEILTEELIEIDGMNLPKTRYWWITTDSLAPIYSGKDEIIGSSTWVHTY